MATYSTPIYMVIDVGQGLQFEDEAISVLKIKEEIARLLNETKGELFREHLRVRGIAVRIVWSAFHPKDPANQPAEEERPF